MEILTAQQVVISQLLCLIILVSVQCAWEATLIGKRSIPGFFAVCLVLLFIKTSELCIQPDCFVLHSFVLLYFVSYLEFKLGYFTNDKFTGLFSSKLLDLT